MTELEHGAHCSAPTQNPPKVDPGLPDGRLSAIIDGVAKWVNGTVLHYWFFDANSNPAWVGAEDQKAVVRASFQAWKDLGLGLEFREVAARGEAEVRIGFDQSDGSWSYVGRDILPIAPGERTMNFGWDLTTPYGHTTALHEIGHTLGMPHEHQNPFAGIVWDEQKVYDYFRGPPNNWPDDQTLSNVLAKLSPDQYAGSKWDPDSIMEYWFPEGLITEPAQFHAGLQPPGTISPVDVTWMKSWYPGEQPAAARLEALHSVVLSLQPRQQVDFTIEPAETRDHRIATFGAADTVMVLFEEIDGEPRYVAGDDDSGTDRNATITARLEQGHRYVVRLRLYSAFGSSGQLAVMYW